ncbi:MAG: helix-turn-helix domain-containing protein [Clostridia bacterium]|nr:helix-turn-helix domain-containing protein [Clostridia bacterium]
MDEYNRFLYNDQGKQIVEMHERSGMTVTEYAEHLSVDAGKLRKWEGNMIRVSKRTWEKLFREPE